MSVLEVPYGACSAATIEDLWSYSLSNETISSLCAPPDGCTSTQNCLNTYFVDGVSAAQEQLTAVQTQADETVLALNVAFMLYNGYMVFLMQLGFAMLCAGCIRSKNCMNILLKNTLDACVGAIAFYLFGYAFAYGVKPGQTGNPFIGNWNFALSYTTSTSASGENFAAFGWQNFFFQWSFCASTVTLVSGAVAERCAFTAYMLYAFFLSSFVYPVVAHWVWDPYGWLSAFNTQQDGYALILKTGAIDFAGSGVVHMIGGFASLMGAWIMGPRIGRFGADGTVNVIKGHSPTLVVMGTLILFFGWFGFNPGSNLVIASQAAATIVARVAVNTALAGGSGAISMLYLTFYTTKTYDLLATCNGLLAGLVAVCSSVSVIEPWAAIICGALAPLFLVVFDHLTLHIWKVDDPVGCFALHGGVGIFGVLFPGFLAAPHYMLDVYGAGGLGMNLVEGKRFGLFYGGHGQVLLVNFIEILVIIAWVCGLMGGFFYALKLLGMLRVSPEEELAGLDLKHDKSNRSKYDGSDDSSADGSESGSPGRVGDSERKDAAMTA